MAITRLNGKIHCPHRIFYRRDTDVDVTEQPIKTFIVHSCEDIEVYQERKGMKRYYYFKTC